MSSILTKLVGGALNLSSFFSVRFAANNAIFLFSKPRRKKQTEAQKDFLDTAYKEELKYENLPIMTYRWLGEKPTVLLLHGWESDATRWQNIVRQLTKIGHCVIAIDAPAHGKSGSNIFNAMLYSDFIQTAIKRFKPTIIIGHSVGGMAAIIAIDKYKIATIDKIILLGAPSEFKDVLKRYYDMMGYNNRIINTARTIIFERFGKNPEEVSVSQYLKDVNIKGLIIHDEKDTIIPYSDAVLLKENFPNSVLVTTSGIGHSLNNESVNEHIFKFIEI